jgi:hypothetical protein
VETADKKQDRNRFTTLPVMEETGFVKLKHYQGPLPQPAEWESLQYVDWRSGGDTNFAILASANGEHVPRGFWEHGKPDKDGVWTDVIDKLAGIKKWVESVGPISAGCAKSSWSPPTRPRPSPPCTPTTTTASHHSGGQGRRCYRAPHPSSAGRAVRGGHRTAVACGVARRHEVP